MILTPHLVLRNDSRAPAALAAATATHPLLLCQDPGDAAPQGADPNAAETVSRGRSGAGTLDQQGDPNKPNTPNGGGVPQGCFDQQSLIFVLLFVGVIYFMMLRPQQKQEKKLREMRSALKKGDKAVTSAGIHGVVDSMSEHTVTLRVDSDVRLTFDRAAIARVGDEVDAAGGGTPAKS